MRLGWAPQIYLRRSGALLLSCVEGTCARCLICDKKIFRTGGTSVPEQVHLKKPAKGAPPGNPPPWGKPQLAPSVGRLSTAVAPSVARCRCGEGALFIDLVGLCVATSKCVCGYARTQAHSCHAVWDQQSAAHWLWLARTTCKSLTRMLRRFCCCKC